MSKQKEYLELYGVLFQVVKGNGIPRKQYDSIYSAYDRPSTAKQEIWEEWKDWRDEVARDNNDIQIYITGRNCNFFSIGGYIHTPTDEHWAFYITHTRQEIWQIP